MQVIKQTKQVSVIQTEPKQFVIKVPSFNIPVHYLQYGGITLCLIALSGLLISVKSPEIKSVSEIIEPQPDVTETIFASVQSTEPMIEHSNNSSKSIAITDIIKNADVLEFLTHNNVLQRSYEVQQKTGLQVVTILTQKCLESRYGKSKLCELTKNLGNIKCTNKACQKYNVKLSKKGQIGHVGSHCVQLWDDSWKDRYVKFNTYQEGWNWYCSLIERRYKKAAMASSSDKQAILLKALGYASDPNYAKKLIKYSKQWNLDLLQEKINEGYNITSSSNKYTFLKQ